MCKEYIEREAALRVLCDACGNAACPKSLIPRCSYYEKMQSIPAADAIEELSKPRWIPVSERLPKYGERVLVFGGVTMYVAYYDKNRYGGESWHKLNSKSHYCNPTHWMPLPEPPKEE